jgi:N-acetylmuramoyl-L-alanine amidase
MEYSRLLKKGSRGEDVKAVQRALHCYPDGIFGEITEEAVKDWQELHGLGVDGIVGRLTWESLFPAHTTALKKTKRRINRIVVHCTATEEGKDYTVDWIRRIHKKKGWSDIGYHYVIYRDGSLHEGRDINLVGTHARGYNTGSIGVVYVGGCPKGDTHKNKDTRTPEQKATLLRLLKDLRKMYPHAEIVGHKDLNATGCPSFDAKTEYKGL